MQKYNSNIMRGPKGRLAKGRLAKGRKQRCLKYNVSHPDFLYRPFA